MIVKFLISVGVTALVIVGFYFFIELIGALIFKGGK
jgi:hypothetical protein